MLSLTAVVLATADKNVVVLDDKNFDETLSTVEVALVEFYAPWCGHCKSLEPKWNEAADKLAADAELSANVKLCKMDADAQKTVPGRHGVTGFPTIKLFRFGKFAEDYKAERTVDGILNFLREKAKVAVNKEISTLSNLKALTNPKNVARTTIVGFFASKESVDFKYYSSVVTEFSATGGLDAYFTASSAVLEGFGFFGSGSSIIMYRPDAKPFKVQYRGTIFKQQLREWILENAVPQIGKYTKESEALYASVGSALIRFVTAPGTVVDAALLTALAAKNKNVKFATSSKEDFKSDFESVCPDQKASICVIGHEASKNGKAGRVFSMDGAVVNEQTVSDFITSLQEKKLKQRVKSEAPGAAPAAGEVAVVVGTTFESIVGDNEKDVLIEFYAPWCGHCKNLAPKYEALAASVASNFDKLVIAKMDMTSNDLPAEYQGSYPVSGFPTLFLAPRGKKKSPIQYEGPREAEAMKSWIEEKVGGK